MRRMKIGYARVSTREQNLNLQLDALRAAGCLRIFQDKLSANAAERPGLAGAFKAIRAGDQLVVWKLDRFARDLLEQMLMLRDLQRKGASLVSLTEAIDTSDWMSDIMSRQFGIYAEMEVRRIRERTRAGLAAAKARGVKLGAKPKLSDAQVIDARSMIRSGAKPKVVAAEFGIGRSTLYRYLRTKQRQQSENPV